MGVPMRFTPLCGAGADGGPLAHLLEIGPPDATLTLLLDCGWGGCADGSAAALQPVIDALPRVDAVLLSHPDLRHCGGLPIAVGRHGLAAPVFGTAPIARMGAMFAYDAFLSAQATCEFGSYDLDDADRAFAAVTKLKFTQPATIPGPCAAALAARLGCGGVVVTPYAAGHLVGGCVWRVEVAGEEVVYAPDTNHRKERHLAGCDLEAVASRPALLVVGAASAATQPVERARRDASLLEPLMAALRGGGNVLLPVDTAGRVLELLLLLDDHWGENNLRDTYPLVLLSTVGPSTLEFAQASLEWMSDGVTRAFETGRGNPFKLRNVRQVGNMAELAASPLWHGARPLVVLASGPDLNPGTLSREVLLQWARDPRALVLFTQRPRPGSLAAAIAGHGGPGPLLLPALPVSRRVRLEGPELEAWEVARAREREEEEAAAAAAEADAALVAGGGQVVALRSSSVGLSQLVKGSGGELVQLLPGADDPGPAPGGGGGGGVCDTLMEGFVPPPGAAAAMFPDEDEALAATWDVYGAPVDTDAWAKLAGAASAEVEEDADGGAAAEEEARPTKVVTEAVSLAVAARAALVDFEGRSDGRSLRTVVAQLAPRQLVVVGAGPAAVGEMAAGWREDLAPYHSRILAPGPGEVVPLSLARTFPVSLHPHLLSGATSHLLGQYTLAWLDARLAEEPPAAAAAAEMAEADGQQLPEGGGGGGSPGSEPPAPAALRLQLVPGGADGSALEAALERGGPEAVAALLADVAAGGDHGGIFIGDVRLSEVKQALAKAGIASAFRAGKLLCAGAVVVGRGAGGDDGVLEIEGPLSDDYYRVRDVVYGQYQVC
ncbi:MAG: beta-lactamase-like protein [Monoraphidium minutum]|nr:MAG: beta-lactamase-like protein [Monoraphidium minutum]